MAEVKDTPSAPAPAAGTRGGAGFELRLERSGVFVRLEGQLVAPGVRLEVLTLRVPDVKFPFDVGQGAGQFRHRLAELVDLSVTVEPDAAERAARAAGLAAFGVGELQLAPREGFVEIGGRLSAGPAFSLEAGLLAVGDQGLSLVFHAPRILGPAPLPAVALPHLARSVLAAAGPDVAAGPLAPLLRRILAPRGWKIPGIAGARLARATIAGGAARIAWDRVATTPVLAAAEPDLLDADEGARAFREAEALLARGDFAGARDAYLSAGPAATAHPFAAERLLSLLALEERFHDEALDLAAEWLGRRPGFEPALATEALLRAARGESARAARAFGALAAGAAARGRAFLALAAAEAVLAVPGAPEEETLRAVDVALRLRRDHLPALRALRDVSRARGDREGLLRASRRIVAYEPDPAGKARAHAELGELLLEADPPGARLHLDQALRLAPDDLEAQAALARACAAAGEPLRAVRALDRLRELLSARGERGRAARAALDAGALWEGPLAHPENALLRFRDAAELAPSAETHTRAARAAEAAGHWVEAADHHAAALAALAALDPEAPGAAQLEVGTHVALADIAERRLGDPAGAVAHLEKAAAIAADAAMLRRLVPLQRALGRNAEALRALDRLAGLEGFGGARAAVLAEAGEVALALGLAGDARDRFAAAIAADPACRPALLGAARLARERGDAVAERDALERLLPLAHGAEAADVLDRLAAARERAGDLAGASAAAASARATLPTPARLEAALALARRAGDPGAVSALLADRARAAAAAGDGLAATEAWLERAQLVAANPPQALAALAEARALSPGDPRVLRAQAELSERAGDARLALGCLRALLAARPGDAPSLEVRAARAALAAGEVGAAKDHAERALAAGAPGAAEALDEILSRTGDDAGRADLLARVGRHLEAARLLERQGDETGARAALERAAADPATAARALPRLAELRLAADDRPGAAAALLALARLGEGSEAARLALRAWATGRDPAALDVAVEKAPRFAPALARRASLRAAEAPRAALADAQAALAGEELPEDERPGLLAVAAAAAAACGDGAAARRHLAAYCEVVPDDEGALSRLAALHRAAGAREDLARVLARRLELVRGPDAARVRLELSDLLAAREPQRAVRLALDALALDPSSAEALRALTTAPRAAHVPPAERAALLARLADAAAATPAEAAGAHVARARLLVEGGDLAGAVEAAREAGRLGEEPDDLLELRARLADAQGDRTEAARALLARARRAEARGEPQAAEQLAEAGLRAVGAGLAGGEEALRAALALQPERETARAALEALVSLARARKDATAERELLRLLVPTLPTGARPAALLRLSGLAREANDAALARASAEEARTLAPRDLAAVEACRAAAQAAGDLATVAELLAEAAALDPAGAAPRLLERARLLADLGAPEEADDAYTAAVAALPADRALAEEQARLRRDALPARSPAAPVEAFARRCADPGESSSALRAAAALAVTFGDLPGALRCARAAWECTGADPAFVGPLLARIVYLMGGGEEALAVHRRLVEEGVAATAADDAILRQAAELAASAGDVPLALRALDELLRLRPQELDAALQRLELDPDRPGAVRALAAAVGGSRSHRQRALALSRAAAAALGELSDHVLAAELHERARQEAAGLPALGMALALDRAAAIRAAEGTSSPAFLAALRDASATAEAAGDRAAARDLLEEAIQRQRERGLFAEAAHDLIQLDALAAAEGDFAESAHRLRSAGALLREAGDLAGAAEVLQRAYAANPDSDETARRLEEVLRELGAPAGTELADLLSDRAARANPGPERADALVQLADALSAAGAGDRAERALQDALAEAPGHAHAEDRLLELLAASRRATERARLLLERSARAEDPAARNALRREAAAALAASPDPADRDLAAETWLAVVATAPGDLEAARAAAGLLLGLDRRADAAPLLEALVRADPDDEAAAEELTRAWIDRPRDRARLLRARAERREGEGRAGLLREAAAALFAAGEDDPARAALREAFEAWPADAAAFEEAVRDASGDLDRLDAVLATRARAVPAEAASCHRARGDALREAGRAEEAVAAYEAALAAGPGDPAVSSALASTLAEARGDAAAADLDRALVARAESGAGDVPAEAEAPARYRLGLALSFAGGPAEAVPHLERALALAPHDGHAGLGWAALAQGYAARGDAASALAAARARAERAGALRLEEERRAALEAEAELAERFGLPSALGPAHVELHPGEAPADDFEPPEGHAEEPVAFEPSEDRAEEPVAFEPPEDAREEPVAFQPDEDRVAADDPAARTAAWLASADALARSGASRDDVRAALEMACEIDPDAPLPWRERARHEEAMGDPVAAARAHLAVWLRSDAAEAAEAALHAARLFEESALYGDAARAYRAALHVRPDAVPEPIVDAADALADGDRELAALHLSSVDPETLPALLRAPHARKLAELQGATADGEDLPTPPPVEAEARGGDQGDPFDRFAEGEAPEEIDLPPPSDDEAVEGEGTVPEAQAIAREGRERMEAADWTGAYEKLALALAREPSDLTLARDLSRVCEKLGLYDEYVQLGEVTADAISAYDPLAAAARYRHFAEVLLEKVHAPDRAASMLEKALALLPDDQEARRQLLSIWTGLPAAAPRALEAWLELARKDPADAPALAAVAQLCERIAAGAGASDAGRLRERGRIAASLAAFVAPATHPAPAQAGSTAEVPAALRTRVAAPGATGPLARLLALLAPWLESLFPADLGRRGAGPDDLLEAARAPSVAAAFEGAADALGARPRRVFLLESPPVEVAVENTQPPSIVLGGGVASLDEVALSFLAARTLDLVDHGWALAGKFSPRDVGILLELACRFAGGAPSSRGLPPERAGAFFAVLETQVPRAARTAARELAAAASQELDELDPRALVAALRRTANRVGLLHAGDPGAALRVLALVDRRLEGGPADPSQALALPDLRDLALFALSEPFLELRAASLG